MPFLESGAIRSMASITRSISPAMEAEFLENLGKLFEDLVGLGTDFATITGWLSFVLHRSSTKSTHLLSTTSKSPMCKLIPETEPTIHRVRCNWRQREELQPKGVKNEFIDIIW